MDCILSGAQVFYEGRLRRANVFLSGGRIADLVPFSPLDSAAGSPVIQLNDRFLFPGFADVHVHLREPGFSYKEDVASGSAAAARGGFTAVCAMPNLDPVPDSPAHLAPELSAIAQKAVVRVFPYGALTVGERGERAADLEGLAPLVAAFSDDGKGVQDEGLMRALMKRVKALDKLIAAHCEDERFPAANPESEWRMVARDLRLAAETGCSYHVCHISCKKSADLMRDAKKAGLDVSCETAPHYLLLDDTRLRDEGNFKMNPPLRTQADREALAEALADGVIDCVATDHAPHTAKEKSGGFAGSLNGVVGLETAFAALYTGLVKTGALSLETLLARMSGAPAKRFGLGGGELAIGAPADLSCFDLTAKTVIDPETFASRGRATPFAGCELFGVCQFTMVNGRTVWQNSTEKFC